MKEVIERLRAAGIQPSAQRVAVGSVVLDTEAHPSADEVWEWVKRRFPVISRATVYNTLNLFVRKGLLRSLTLAPGRVVFDPKQERHHHFVEEGSGKIHDVPWDAVEVRKIAGPPGFELGEWQVVMRGRKAAKPAGR